MHGYSATKQRQVLLRYARIVSSAHIVFCTCLEQGQRNTADLLIQQQVTTINNLQMQMDTLIRESGVRDKHAEARIQELIAERAKQGRA